jgi:hypothetical protein
MARWRRIDAGPRTRELVSWSLGVVVVLAVVLLVLWLGHRWGWSWP